MRRLNIYLLMVISILANLPGEISAGQGDKFSVNTWEKIRIRTDLMENYHGFDCQGYLAGIKDSVIYISTRGDIRIDKAVKKDGTVIIFELNGAKYFPHTKTIEGRTEDGKALSIPVSEINYVSTTMYIKDKTVERKIRGAAIDTNLKSDYIYPEIQNRIKISSVVEVEKWRKTNGTAVAFSAAIGCSLGFLYGYTFSHDDPPSRGWEIKITFSREFKIGALMVLGSVVGYAVGRVVGKEGWQKVNIKKYNISLKSESSKNPGLSLVLEF